MVIKAHLIVQKRSTYGATADFHTGVILHMTVGTAAEDGSLDIGTRLYIDFGIMDVCHLHGITGGSGSQTAAAAIDETAVKTLLLLIGRVAYDTALDMHLGIAGIRVTIVGEAGYRVYSGYAHCSE